MLLTDDERRRFAAYLKQDAMSNRLIAEQLEKIPAPPMAALAKQKREIAVAQLLVAHQLENCESQTIR